MTASNRIVLSSDHAAILLRQAIAAHIVAQGWVAVDIGPTTQESTHYPKHGEAAARRVASGDCQLGIILCGTGQGIMMAANKIKGIRCGVCLDTFSARMIRQHNDANMLSIGARVVGEGLPETVTRTVTRTRQCTITVAATPLEQFCAPANKKYCPEIQTCGEAYFRHVACNHVWLDGGAAVPRDGQPNGIPCKKKCGKNAKELTDALKREGGPFSPPPQTARVCTTS